MHLIETRNLTHVYRGDIPALGGVDFIAERKSRIAVIGPNGAGKSTLFKHFNGILKPTSGEVLVRGEPITRENIREVRKFVGIVFQNPDDQIFSPTVEQDVAFGPANLGLDEATVAHRVGEALSLLGIEDLRERVPHHLSGGEKKRVAIAGILAMEPQVVVLDEPTAGLDPDRSDSFVRLIRMLGEELGLTVVLVTHDLDTLAALATRVAVLAEQHILAYGSIDDIMRIDHPFIRNFFHSERSQRALAHAH